MSAIIYRYNDTNSNTNGDDNNSNDFSSQLDTKYEKDKRRRRLSKHSSTSSYIKFKKRLTDTLLRSEENEIKEENEEDLKDLKEVEGENKKKRKIENDNKNVESLLGKYEKTKSLSKTLTSLNCNHYRVSQVKSSESSSTSSPSSSSSSDDNIKKNTELVKEEELPPPKSKIILKKPNIDYVRRAMIQRRLFNAYRQYKQRQKNNENGETEDDIIKDDEIIKPRAERFLSVCESSPDILNYEFINSSSSSSRSSIKKAKIQIDKNKTTSTTTTTTPSSSNDKKNEIKKKEKSTLNENNSKTKDTMDYFKSSSFLKPTINEVHHKIKSYRDGTGLPQSRRKQIIKEIIDDFNIEKFLDDFKRKNIIKIELNKEFVVFFIFEKLNYELFF
jgi:hypothetical protein